MSTSLEPEEVLEHAERFDALRPLLAEALELVHQKWRRRVA